MVEQWLALSLVALVTLGVMNFLMKFLVDSIHPYVLLTLVFGTEAIVLLIFLIVTRTPFILPAPRLLGLTLLAGGLFAVSLIMVMFGLRQGFAVKVIPIINLNTLVTVALAVLFLHEGVTMKTAAGIGAAIVSLYLLST